MQADEKIGGPDGGIMGCLPFTPKRGKIMRKFSAAPVLFLVFTERRGESCRPIAQQQDRRRRFQSEKTKNAKKKKKFDQSKGASWAQRCDVTRFECVPFRMLHDGQLRHIWVKIWLNPAV